MRAHAAKRWIHSPKFPSPPLSAVRHVHKNGLFGLPIPDSGSASEIIIQSQTLHWSAKQGAGELRTLANVVY